MSISSIERQKGFTASHLHTQLYPFASKLTICTSLLFLMFISCPFLQTVHFAAADFPCNVPTILCMFHDAEC